MRQQQVWQIESGKPPRRLSVGEAAAFARVFGLSLAELMTPPDAESSGLDHLIALGRAFVEWRRDAAALFSRLSDIAAQIDTLDDDNVFTADVVVKYGGYSGIGEQFGQQLGELEDTISDIRRSIAEHGNPWSLIVSLQDQVAHEGDAQPGDRSTRPIALEEALEQPVVAAIVTSELGVLVGRRNDGVPPWGFISGKIEPGESPADAAVREVKEETGCEIEAGQVIGERVHPKTGRTMIYMAGMPVRGTKVIVGDEQELAEVRWVSLAEADELLPGMFEPVREYLAGTIGLGARL